MNARTTNANAEVPKRRTRRARRWPVVSLLASALVGGWIYLTFSPKEYVGSETGHVIAAPDDERHATIQLASGELVSARVPRGADPQQDRDVSVRVYEASWPPYARSYELAVTRD